jgi:hypothetical protein
MRELSEKNDRELGLRLRDIATFAPVDPGITCPS